MDDNKPLTYKQQLFVREYLVDFNATAAYKRAGYRAEGHSAESAAQRLLSNVEVKAAVEAGIEDRSEKLEVTADDVDEELCCIGFNDPGDILDFSGEQPKLKPANEISTSARRAISSIKAKRYVEGKGDDARTVEIIEFKFWDKNAALEKLGKRRGMFRDQMDLNVSGGVEIVEEVVDENGNVIPRQVIAPDVIAEATSPNSTPETPI